ncbi:MAG: hypothetical protein ACREHD_07200 [Pirellulales bacterium]
MTSRLDLAVVLVMVATAAVAQIEVKVLAEEQNVAEKPGPPVIGKQDLLPSLAELMNKMADYERAYFPFHIKAAETFRMGKGLTQSPRARYPWGDGRKHGKLMEYAQKADRIWVRKETQVVDYKPDEGHVETYSDGKQRVQLSFSPRGRRTNAYIDHNPASIARSVWATPVIGVFPLSAFPDGERLTRLFENEPGRIRLDWDDDDARLTFEFGPGRIRTRFVLWLSRAHDWHPIKLRRYMSADAKHFLDEWMATKLVKEDGRWRMSEGTVRCRDDQDSDSPDAKVMYSVDFTVLSAEWGRELPDGLFDIEIPDDAQIHDRQQPKAPEPVIATREVAVRVVDLDERPVAGARVLLRGVRELREFDRVATDEDGFARSTKAPDDDVGLKVEADGFRPAEWVIGRSANQPRVILTPRTLGLTIDERAKPMASVWITSDEVLFRADGLPHPGPLSGARAPDQSHDGGRFELKKSLTLRNLKTRIPLIAIDESLARMAIRFLAPRELAEDQTLILRPVCQIRAAFILEGVAEPAEVGAAIVAGNDQSIGSAPAKTRLTPAGLRAEFQLRLPEGKYALRARPTVQHAGFELPFTVAPGEAELDLGTTTVAAPHVAQAQPAVNRWGNLRGRFVYDGIPPRAAEVDGPTSIHTPPRVFDESLVVGNDGGLANVVLFVTSQSIPVHPDYVARDGGQVAIEMRGLKFVPHVAAVQVSQTLVLKNSDAEPQNVNLAPPGDQALNHLLQPKAAASHQFRKSQKSPVEISSSLYPWMKGWIVVRDNPYIAVTGSDGEFTLKNLPAGEWQFRAWHERAGWLSVGQGATEGRESFRLAIRAGENSLGTIRVVPKRLGVAESPVDPFNPRKSNSD